MSRRLVPDPQLLKMVRAHCSNIIDPSLGFLGHPFNKVTKLIQYPSHLASRYHCFVVGCLDVDELSRIFQIANHSQGMSVKCRRCIGREFHFLSKEWVAIVSRTWLND